MSRPASPLVLAVPVLNGARFLSATLASLNAQGTPVRWWLQDGGSTDGTVEMARSLARPEDVIVSEADGGQADALNRAIPKMGGEVIGFINGDDLLAPEAAARVLDFFAAHPEVDLVYGAVEWIDAQGGVTGTHTGRIQSLDEVLDIYGVWWNQRQWVQPEVFYRRALFEKVGGFDSRYQLAFDYDFWVRCFLAGARVAHLPAVLARFRLHPAQKSRAAEAAADEIRAILRRHLDRRPPIRTPHRWALEARLSYDLFQSGKAAPGARRRSFFGDFLRHPHWLLSPEARTRAQAACRRLLAGRRSAS
ncbi:MAG: hypothetical protein QOE70_1470 [Chthoniobacter sp.]|jgi:glycosyltransferase involved in cell wall biosynthesis|nr:hypothetical protein [Chthoniobacter sp.]